MNSFTLIIPVFNRFTHLPSLIKRYQNINTVFVDSSKEPFKYPAKITKIICKDKLLYESLYDALKYIKTDYICWNNDDDIVLESFIKKAVAFLENNRNYSNVLGMQIKENSTYGLNEFLTWHENSYYSDNKKKRIDFMMNFFHTPAHAVMRRKCLVDACSIPLSDERFFPIKYFDRILGIVQACEGNKKVLPYVSLLRSKDRMVNQSNYPERLRKHVEQKTMLRLLHESNVLTKYLERHGISRNEISTITFNNKTRPKKLLPTSGFKITDHKLLDIVNYSGV